MEVKKTIVSGLVSAIIGSIIIEITYGVAIGAGVAAIVLIHGVLTGSENVEPNPAPIDEPDDLLSMSDVTEAAIREKLDHPNMQIQNVDTDDGGAWFANVSFTGGKRNLDRVISPEFDVKGKPLDTSEGTHARLIPNLAAWSDV